MSPALQQRYHSDFLPGGANAITEQARDQLLVRLAALRTAMRGYFAEQKITVLAYPPTITAALPIGEDTETSIGGEQVPLSEVMARNIAHGSAVGMACLVLPAGLTRAGLPVGIGFDMLPGKDEELLALGLTLELNAGADTGASLFRDQAHRPLQRAAVPLAVAATWATTRGIRLPATGSHRPLARARRSRGSARRYTAR